MVRIAEQITVACHAYPPALLQIFQCAHHCCAAYAVIMRRADRLLLIGVFALGLSWLAIMLLRSPGALLDDEITHALISLNAWRYPEALLDVWGRPGNTTAYMLPMLLGGLEGRRIAAIIMSGLTAACAVAMAPHLGVRARWLITLCFFFQPWIAGLGFQSVTEIPFSLALAAGVLAWMRGRWGLAGLCFGLLALIRHEGVALLGLWLLYALARHEWRSAALVLLPLALYNLAFLILFGRLASGNLLEAVPTTEYGAGSWFHFLPLLVAGAGPGLIILFVLGLAPASRQRDDTGRVPRDWALLYFAPYLAYFAVHTVIFRFGLFASGGYGIFLLPLAPAVAVLAARGGEWAWQRLNRASERRGQIATRIALLPAALALGLIISSGMIVPPTPLDPLHSAQRAAADWVIRWLADDPNRADTPVAATHVAFWLEFRPEWPTSSEPWWFDPADLPAGSLLVYDSKYSPGRNITPGALEQAGWRELARFGDQAAIIYQREGA